ncbi:transglycosylase domain-containing protein [Virgibacillus halodenitrificans]|uniref:PBP1A family penicillin-binding protein n=1 Tax=Virgibacillus halodenitrificans TaxID=1482 RepID=A0ABR7VLL2_VIRHA|nr:PBP1A family penicillin-binding protein [Virgibacillus halodenitrificans]MBD1222578.1 PBP1A family penicillin-binding protein [Virgibacillus halodenitrificans]
MADKSQTRTARRKQKKTKKKPIWKKILVASLIFVLVIGLGVAAVGTYWIVTAPDIEASKLSDPLASQVLDKDGDVFATPGDQKRTKIEYDDLPQILVDAVTATEDARFFEHSGIDLRRIGGAVIANFTNGFGSEGASTITQQVVEKSFLSPEKKISLKVQEQWLALKLERKYSKEEILEMYLNKIFYGSNAYGVARAADVYFGKKELSELTLPEAAILAGLPQRPTAYNPFKNPELTKKRMNTVLTLMVRHNKITQEEADEARKVDIPSLLNESKPDSIKYDAFLDQVRKEVSEKLDGADIDTDGLKIHTTLDKNIQEHVEFLLKDKENSPISYPDEEMQAGMVVLDTKNGAIRSIGGNRSEKAGGLNYAIDLNRQPGSTAKPILSYGPAIEYDKISTYHQINDDKPYDEGVETPIRNWNRQYGGWMSARYALAQSLNVPAVKLAKETGLDNAQEFGEGLGYKFDNDQIDIRDVIGGTGTGVSPLQLAGAYRAFGNEGIYNEPYAVTKVEFPDGKVVELQPKPEAAMSDYTAYMVTDMLKSVMTEGTGKEANIPGLHVAGKTGTTNHTELEGSPDSWFSGYTTNYTISIWTGYNDYNKTLPNTKIPHALFKNTMTEISKDKETADFEKPNSVVEVAVEKGSQPARLPSDFTPSSQIVKELFVKGTEPKKTSEKYDELDPVSDLKASYDKESNTIDVKWKYDADEKVNFEVSTSVDGGEMQSLSSTEDKTIQISEVEKGAEYTIQVVAVSSESSSMKSEPVTTSVNITDEEEEEEDTEEENEEEDSAENIPAVSGLSAKYNEENSIIDVSWNYNGPPASFEVSVNGQTQSVQSNGIEISGASPGQSYTIQVTPIGQEGANKDAKGEPQSTQITVPESQNEETNGNEDSQEDQSNEDNQEESGEEGQNEG